MFERWTTIWNFFIEKEMGQPQINKLWALHLIKADYNLLLKWFGPKGFIKRSEDIHQLMDSQGGGRCSRSAIDLACKKVATYDYLTVTHTPAANFEFNLQACFDFLVRVCMNLSCLQHGADPRYVKLHAQTQCRLKYHIKHAYGMSEAYNQYSEEHPWHGAGQGTGHAGARWIVQSHSLITSYHHVANLWSLWNPITQQPQVMGLDAFMDDTTPLIGNDDDYLLSTLILNAQFNVDLWQGLISASGGALNPSKCSWTPFLWGFNNCFGHPTLLNPPDQPSYHITTSDRSGIHHALHRNTPQQAVHILGVHIAVDGSYNKELNVLRQRQTQYCAFLNRTPLTQREARIIYKQCYLPKVTYPFPAMVMPPKKIYQTQLTVTCLFLNKMGYPRHMP